MDGFAFQLGDKVKINAHGCVGTVEGRWDSRGGEPQYQVKWARLDLGVSCEWFRGDELARVD